jgi:hypothetical protein
MTKVQQILIDNGFEINKTDAMNSFDFFLDTDSEIFKNEIERIGASFVTVNVSDTSFESNNENGWIVVDVIINDYNSVEEKQLLSFIYAFKKIVYINLEDYLIILSNTMNLK